MGGPIIDIFSLPSLSRDRGPKSGLCERETSSPRSAVALRDSDPGALLPQLLLDRGSGSHRQAPDVCNSLRGVALEALKLLEPEGAQGLHHDLEVGFGSSTSTTLS